MSFTMARGVSVGSRDHSGSARSTAASVSLTVSPENACFPVSISNNRQPKAKMSARLSTRLPRACSGLMYAAVPRITPAMVGELPSSVGECDRLEFDTSLSTALARPKSSTFTIPPGVTTTLAGFKSRCTMPWSCADSIASATWRAIAERFLDRDGPAREALVEIFAFHELEHEHALGAVALDAVNGGDVRVVQRGEEFGLALETGEALGIGGEAFGKHLERHVAAELRVARTIDFAHAAFAQVAGDFVMCNGTADHAKKGIVGVYQRLLSLLPLFRRTR